MDIKVVVSTRCMVRQFHLGCLYLGQGRQGCSYMLASFFLLKHRQQQSSGYVWSELCSSLMALYNRPWE